MTAIFTRELKSYYTGLTGYVLAAVLLVFAGIYTAALNLVYGYPNFEYVLDSMTLVYLVLIPLLTMGLVAGERQKRTDVLLRALPLRPWDIVLGKFLAAWAALGLPLALTAVYPLILGRFGTVNYATAYAGLLAFFLMGGALIAAGMFLSALTENQFAAGALCFGVMLADFSAYSLSLTVSAASYASFMALMLGGLALAAVVWYLTKKPAAGLLTAVVLDGAMLACYLIDPALFAGVFSDILQAVCVFTRMTGFVNGVFDGKAILYFLTVIALFLCLTALTAFRPRRERTGGYPILTAALAIVLAVAVNLAAGRLPASVTQRDLSAGKLFTLSEQSTALARELYAPVTIYWIVTDGGEDPYLSQLLPLYEDLSAEITVERVDPVARPGFAGQYTDRSPALNDLVVVSGDRSSYVPCGDLYRYDDAAGEAQFAGESAITGAIGLVTGDGAARAYLLTGHGETAPDSALLSGLRGLNLETASLDLRTVEAVPEDANCVVLIAPRSDLTEPERDALLSYLDGGGQLLLLTDCDTDGQWPNLRAVTLRFGLEGHTGLVVESDGRGALAGYPNFLLPALGDHAITQPIAEGGYTVLVPFSGAIAASDPPSGVTVTALLESTDGACLKSEGSLAETLERSPGDPTGSFLLAAAAEDAECGARMVWCAGAKILDPSADSLSGGANTDFFLNAMAWLCGQTAGVSIHPKTMDSQVLTVPARTASLLTVTLCFLLPAAVLVCGIAVTVKRRRR